MASLSSALCYLYFLLIFFPIVGRCSRRKFETYHTINIRTLLPRNVCSSSEASRSLSPASIKVVHRHGPCSPLHLKQNPNHEQILDKDRSRVNAIHSRTATIPAHTGDSLGTGNYIVTIGFGSPKREQSVIFDTGSDLTWIQCEPCLSCYQQHEPIFDPSQSSTYANISCSSSYCSELDISGCTSSTCVYGVQYGDGSSTLGILSEDALTLTSSNVLPNFRFGCGKRNNGLFGEAAGLLGLGRKKVSVVSQAFQKFGSIFAYCLPSTSSSTGYLTFGGSSTSSNVKFTPMLTNPSMPTFYYLDLVAIHVGGRRLSISPTVFSKVGTIMDSGTVITRLPPVAYSSLRSAFRRLMSCYRSAQALSILDTCYDLTGYSKVRIPKVALQFGGGIATNLDTSGILYLANASQACLAFAGNSDAGDSGIIGNMQQKKFHVVYDVANKAIGFGPNGC
ncbi:aspartyl protease family protein At5g10770-like [Phoenix dactylifera]|uniref:Aspartyl protease family protein At5g10770-like n=1 Tax=Phoenix dactylifera TaxID=42345 RepID=A0A8B8J1E7_PHODC|nr:aspartyl protease family protein At5g10770-like [Phoenix dactylifera]